MDELYSLAAEVLTLCQASGETLAVSESCTGGALMGELTRVPGASRVLLGGFVTYTNEMKQTLLSVSPETLSVYGAVSEETAREMAEGTRRRSSSSLALSVTGFAGPEAGPEAPVGTVCIGLATRDGCTSFRHRFSGDREAVRRQAMHSMLAHLRQALKKED